MAFVSRALLNHIRRPQSARILSAAWKWQNVRAPAMLQASMMSTAAPAAAAEEQMFCFQCEQTRLRKGCTTIGVCGKTPQVAELQDLLVHVVKGLSLYSNVAAKMGCKIPFEIYDFTFSALFSTLTNVNFDPDRFTELIKQAVEYRQQLKDLYEAECQRRGTAAREFSQTEAMWQPAADVWLGPTELLEAEGRQFGVNKELELYGADVHGVRQMIIYGLKGMSTYARHARLLGEWDDAIGAFTHEVLAFLIDGPEAERHDLGINLQWALKIGEFNLRGMSLLDTGHKKRFGVPTPTQVSTTPVPGKAILVTGHDMNDLEMILKATDGSGINVYTHGEMLPAHGYPELHKYKHLAGHYGGAWQNQKIEFPGFPGPIVVTTNCVIEPMKSYKQRLYTVNETGWPGCHHIHLPDEADKLVSAALEERGFTEEECKPGKHAGDDKVFSVGFGHDTILANADKVLNAVSSGELKRVFVIGGCDGSENKRSYFTTLAKSLPPETLILTMGCAKFRFNRQDFGSLGSTGLPRLLDMGQCNDSYGAVVVASALADALKTDVNSLPLSVTLSWFEQKAVAVLLTMFHLGIRNMRIGPVLPAFLTPKVVDILVEKFNVVPCDMKHPEDDMKVMLQQQN